MHENNNQISVITKYFMLRALSNMGIANDCMKLYRLARSTLGSHLKRFLEFRVILRSSSSVR